MLSCVASGIQNDTTIMKRNFAICNKIMDDVKFDSVSLLKSVSQILRQKCQKDICIGLSIFPVPFNGIFEFETVYKKKKKKNSQNEVLFFYFFTQ